MSSRKRIDFLCFGGEDWWYHNRAHTDMQLMRQFARNGRVLYVNSIVAQKPRLGLNKSIVRKIVRKTKSIFEGLRRVEEGFWVFSPFSLPVQHIPWFRPVNESIIEYQIHSAAKRIGLKMPVVWVVCPTACDIARRCNTDKLVYQRTDRFEDYPDVDRAQISRFDVRLKGSADLTIYASKSLYQAECSQCKRALYVDHGVDIELFSFAAQDPYAPPDIAQIPRPIVGYFGAIDEHKLDMELLARVIDLLPDVSFVFVGAVSADCSNLLKRRNFRLLGQKPYEQIPHYGKMFDVSIIPWRTSSWTKAANPIKLKEYLALGKPVVTTPSFAEIDQYTDVLFVAGDAEAFAGGIRRALADDCEALIEARRKKVRAASWADKARLILAELFEEKRLEKQQTGMSAGGGMR